MLRNKVIFATPNWQQISETWITRMLHSLRPHLGVIITKKTNDKTWKNVPIISSNTILHRFLRTIQGAPSPFPNLGSHRFSNKSNTLLINYADHAIETFYRWKKFKGKVFVHAHGVDFQIEAHRHTAPFDRIRNDSYKSQLVELSKRATIIANSQRTAEKLEEYGINKKNIALKYFGVPHSTKTKRNHRPNLKLLYLGRLLDFKGPDLVINAFEEAARRGFPGTLTIAGDGPLRVTCELLARRSQYSSRIFIIGAVNETEAESLYTSHDAFITHNNTGVLTNRDEAFGVTFIEAMSYGLPIISTSSGAIYEIISAAQMKLITAPADTNAQAKSIISLSSNSNLYELLSNNNILHARKNFSTLNETMSLMSILGLR